MPTFATTSAIAASSNPAPRTSSRSASPTAAAGVQYPQCEPDQGVCLRVNRGAEPAVADLVGGQPRHPADGRVRRQAIVALIRLGDREGDLLACLGRQVGPSQRPAELKVAVEDGRGVGHRPGHVRDESQLLLHCVEQIPGSAGRAARVDPARRRFPTISAVELLKMFKADPRLRGIPVLVIKSYMRRDESINCFRNGRPVIELPGKLSEVEEMVRLIKAYWFGIAGLVSKDDRSSETAS